MSTEGTGNSAWSRAFLKTFRPKPRLTVSQWADLYRHVATGREKGQWRTSRTPHLREIMDAACDPKVERIIMMCSSQIGKALCVDTPIPTPDGWTTMGELRVGDKVLDEFCDPCTVTFATEVMHDRPCFDVEFSDGAVIRADAEHRWAVNGYSLDAWTVVTTLQLRLGDWVPEVWCVDSANLVYPARSVVDIRPVESVPVRCIQVSSDSHVFLAGCSMIPTHNTEVQLNILGYYMSSEPTEILFVFPTDDAAAKFSKERLSPTIEGTQVIRERITEDAPTAQTTGRKRRRQASETVQQKLFHGGFLAMVGTQSSANLASRAVQVALIDELDRTSGANSEGSILDQVEQRTNTFIGDRKIVVTSTPHEEDSSPTYQEFLKGDQRHRYIPCVHCGVENTWELDQVRWEKDADNNVITSSIRHICPDCGGVIRGPGTPSEELLESGRWIAHAPKNASYALSYYLWEIYSPWVPLEHIVTRYVEATRSRDPVKLKTFTNLCLGRPYKSKSDDDKLPKRLFDRRETYAAEVPMDVGVLTCGVDTQGSYLIAEVVGWGVGEESWGIEFRVFPGDPSKPQVWEDLQEFLLRPRRHESGHEISIACTLVDSGGHHTSEVYQRTQAMNRHNVFACKGDGKAEKAFISKPTFMGSTKVPLYVLGVNEGKFRLMEWLKETSAGPGYCHFPDEISRGYDREYFDGLLSERYHEVLERGKLSKKWEQIKRRNEPLDCRNYAMAAMKILNPDLESWVSHYADGYAAVDASDEGLGIHGRQLSKGVSL